MSATSEQIREGLAASLRSIPGIHVSGYVLANPTPPFAHVLRGPLNYHEAMEDGTSRWTMVVRVYVAHVSDIGAQKLLDQFLAVTGVKSVKAAIESDPTLGGKVSDLIVTAASGEQPFVSDQGSPLLGSEWTVEVWL